MATVKENLIAAKALIDTPEKWRQDDIDDKFSCCAIIAANRAVGVPRGDIKNFPAPMIDLWSALYAALPPEWHDGNAVQEQFGILVGDYNDDPETTHADIMALFDRAIAAQEPQNGE